MLLNQYFGQYLLNKGILQAEQLSEALILERSVRVKLGVLAINTGLMNAVQVEAVHEMQRAKDKKFGELAIDMGYLTLVQLEELLEIQRNRQMSLSQAIVDLGFLDLASLEQALTHYKRESQLSSEQWKTLNEADYEQAAHLFLDFSGVGGIGEIYYDYAALFLRSIVRFLNDTPILQPNNNTCDYQTPKWLVTQNIVGEVGLVTGIAMDDHTFLEMARRYSQEELTEIDELAECSVAEFLNVVNGIFCVNASDQGVNLDLQPQLVKKDCLIKLNKGCCIPVDLGFGRVELILAEGDF
ncbi:hypothetical protein HA075_10010 [bacterium BFN5]|nr:hypothetical protein HA075_09855 [bacterium BFN5]QJW46147.1 hypothetical protein HA075_10010 [bacterium BFN5]